jgi:alginate O-acetyltransferase complex protein AlgI
MLFHTWIFFLFFLIVYPVYLAIRKTRFKNLWLLIASYVFYGCWKPFYLILIAWSTTVDFLIVRRMAHAGRSKKWLALSIINNLGLLSFFKYGGFLTENINVVLAKLAIGYEIDMSGYLLPVGISFYVFQSMSYTIDFYRGNVERETSFIRYATFVSLFPQLVAGPIERARNLLPQLKNHPRIHLQDFTDGLSLFVVGLFKKVALADYIALYVDQVYGSPGEYQSAALLLATFAFGWQIYFDFSGYTDMARGIGRMLGIRLMLNFNNPYLATGLGDFWRRWHISLSTWFRDYVYVPLGGNRKGKFITYRNLILTLLLSGLWHGAAWRFLVWGAVHAVGFALTRNLERSDFYQQKIPRLLKQLWVFVFVTFAWIFFRASSWDQAAFILDRIFSFTMVDPKFPMLMLLLILLAWGYQFVYESRARQVLLWSPVRIGIMAFMILYVAVFATSSNQPFIYFQF